MTSPPADLPTRAAALTCCQRALQQHGLENWQLEARRLVASAIGCSQSDLIAYPELILSEVEADRICSKLARRLSGEPLSRIHGEREFYGRIFEVTSATLDPRPDTETLIDVALEIIDGDGRDARPLRVLDYGTGTGCIGLTLLAELPTAYGVLADISQAALDVAARNARRLAVSERVRLARVSRPDDIEGPFDLVLSNPPYIPTADIAGLSREVRDFEPRLALDGGPDGLAFYRLLIDAAQRLCPGGWLVMEIGADQAESVAELVRRRLANRVVAILIRPDLAGRSRCIAAKIAC